MFQQLVLNIEKKTESTVVISSKKKKKVYKIVVEAIQHLLTPENFSVLFTDGLIQTILHARLLLK